MRRSAARAPVAPGISAEGFPPSGLFTPARVTGHLNIDRSEQSVGLSDGTAAFEVGYAVDATQITEYR